MKNCLKFIFSITVLTVIISCQKSEEQDCAPTIIKDPCEGKFPITADFEIADAPFATDGNYYPSDNVTPGYVRLKAYEEGATYLWNIEGREYTEQEVVFQTQTEFSEPIMFGDSIKASLIIYKEPDTLCFPNDDGRDTITKSFTVVSGCQCKIIGTYRGVLENELDSFNISIGLIDDSFTGDSCSTITLTQPRAIPGYCENIATTYRITDRSLKIGQTTTACSSLSGRATYSLQGVFEFKYTLNLEDEPEYIFTGRKIEL